MAYTASSLSQVSISGNVITVSGEVVLLKEEALTKTDNSSIDYSNFGNYKAVKITDSASNTQYIVSMIGHNNVYDGVRVDFSSNDTLVKYPIYQHPFELSYLDQPLNEYPDGTANQEQIFDSGLGGSQLRTQSFKYSYESTSASGSTVVTAKYDLLKGAKVGDTVSIKFIKGDTVEVYGFGNTSTIESGLLEPLTGSKNLYNYLIHEMTFTGSATSDTRVDLSSNAFTANTPMSATRPGINKIATGVTTNSSGQKFIEIGYDVQHLGTTSSLAVGELGITASNGLFSSAGSYLLIDYVDVNGDSFNETLPINSYTPGYDLSGRLLGAFISDIAFEVSQFPIITHMRAYTTHSNEINIDHWQGWSRLTEEERDDNIFPKLTAWLVDDPWCFDRSFTDACSIQGSGDENPWYSFALKINASGTSTLPNTDYAVKEQSINKRIQYTGSVIKETNIYEPSSSDGEFQQYFYRTKKYYVSTKDRPSMIRTISLTYHSKSDVMLKIRSEKAVREIVFNSTPQNGSTETVTKVVGMSAKCIDVEIIVAQGYPQSFEIKSIQLQYG